MIYLKKFNEGKDLFIEFMIEWSIDDVVETFFDTRLMTIMKFTKRNNLKSYTIKGFRGGSWEVIIKKPTN